MILRHGHRKYSQRKQDESHRLQLTLFASSILWEFSSFSHNTSFHITNNFSLEKPMNSQNIYSLSPTDLTSESSDHFLTITDKEAFLISPAKVPTVDNSVEITEMLPQSMNQQVFHELHPFTVYAATIAFCTNDGCGPPSRKAYGVTWPGLPSPPLFVEVQPIDYNSLEISWSPPSVPNGNVIGYLAFIKTPYRDCSTNVPHVRRCVISSLPANTTFEVRVQACTGSNMHNQGGGCGKVSDLVTVSTWNGGLDLGLLDALVANNFSHFNEEERLTTSFSLFIPFSLIPFSGTGPLDNITLVVQEAKYYGDPEENTIFTYSAYPFTSGKYQPNPILGTYRDHEAYSGWEVIIPVLGQDGDSLIDTLYELGRGDGSPRNSHYFNGPLQSGTKYVLVKITIAYISPYEPLQTNIVPPVNTIDFNEYLENLLSSPNDNLEIQFRKEVCHPAVFFDASYICSPNYDVVSGRAHTVPYGSLPDFIIASSPTIFSVGDFLFLLVRQRTTLVVMLDDMTSIRRETLALLVMEQKVITEVDSMTARYWPIENGDIEDTSINLENFFSTYHACQVIQYSEHEGKNWIMRKLSVSPVDAMQPWSFIQFQFNCWPKNGVPRVDIFYELVVRCLEHLEAYPIGDIYGPPVIHSRVKDGRAGTFVTAMVLLSQLRNNPQKIDVFGTVLVLHKFRPELIVYKEHLQFLYLFVQYCIDMEEIIELTEEDTHSDLN
nr:receptor type [Hymenolepis microstoma]